MHTYIVRVFVKVQKLFKMDPQQHISLVIFALMAKVNSFKFKDIGWEHANVIVVEDDGGVCDVYFFPPFVLNMIYLVLGMLTAILLLPNQFASF